MENDALITQKENNYHGCNLRSGTTRRNKGTAASRLCDRETSTKLQHTTCVIKCCTQHRKPMKIK